MTTTSCIVQHMQQLRNEVPIKNNDRHVDVLATLHGCMSSSSHAGPARARVILQHDLDWMKTMDLAQGTHGQKMRDRLVKMAQQSDTTQLGYSLKG